jgi:hypothetical protein
MTTWVNSQFPQPDFHRQVQRHYGLQTQILTLSDPKIRGQEPKTLSKRAHNPYGLESAKPDLQSGFKKPGGDIPGPCIWVTVCSGMGEGAIRGGYWGGRRAMGGEMDTAARCGAGFSGCQDHPWDSLN